ncbi:unnamed protein product [Ectocarpus sp. 13 AM-2016]
MPPSSAPRSSAMKAIPATTSFTSTRAGCTCPRGTTTCSKMIASWSIARPIAPISPMCSASSGSRMAKRAPTASSRSRRPWRRPTGHRPRRATASPPIIRQASRRSAHSAPALTGMPSSRPLIMLTRRISSSPRPRPSRASRPSLPRRRSRPGATI